MKVIKFNIYLRLIRVNNWVKNLLLFIPLFFGGKISEFYAILKVSIGFLAFSLMASAIYIINDIKDIDQDRKHPTKRFRPIASGAISIKTAAPISLILVISSIALSAFLSRGFFIVVLSYFALNLFYSLGLKNIAPLDVFIVSFGFILRIYAGGFAAAIPISSWLFLTVFFLSLFVSIAKRRAELSLLKDDATIHRKTLNHYNLRFLDGMMWVTAAASIVTYALYAVSKGNVMVFTVIPAVYGLVRYLQVVLMRNIDDPITLAFKDIHIISAAIIFLILATLNIYL